MAQLSVIEYIARIGKRVQPDSPLLPEQAEGIEKGLNTSLQRLGQKVSDSPDPATRALLQQDFFLTLSSGEVSVPDDMVSSSMAAATVLLTNTTEPLQWLPFYQDVLSPPYLPDYAFFTVSHGKIVVRDYTGSLLTDTALTVYNANYIPTLDEVPATLIDNLLDVGVVLYGEPPAQVAA